VKTVDNFMKNIVVVQRNSRFDVFSFIAEKNLIENVKAKGPNEHRVKEIDY